MSHKDKEHIAIIGLGYVGLPVALAFAEKYNVIGFDIDKTRIKELNNGTDRNNELSSADFAKLSVRFSSNNEDLNSCTIFIIAVPTPVDQNKIPDLSALQESSQIVSQVLKKGDLVIYESTVYPGCTEEFCVPILELNSNLKMGEDFKVGYSPERINPGDKKRGVKDITKVVSGNDEEALEKVSLLYSSIITAGIFKAKSIKVAEAAKIIENTQRDVNIALMNELSMIFDKMDINTYDVIEASSTKWNFLKFYPGLVGGHCIDIDPYYLSYKSQKVGYKPEVILSGRRVNSQIPKFIAGKIIRKLLKLEKDLNQVRVWIKGITFKENVSDSRNSRVIDLIAELESFGLDVFVEDPYVNPQDEALNGIELMTDIKGQFDVLILAVAHDVFKDESYDQWKDHLSENAIFFDAKSIHRELINHDQLIYFSL